MYSNPSVKTDVWDYFGYPGNDCKEIVTKSPIKMMKINYHGRVVCYTSLYFENTGVSQRLLEKFGQ